MVEKTLELEFTTTEEDGTETTKQYRLIVTEATVFMSMRRGVMVGEGRVYVDDTVQKAKDNGKPISVRDRAALRFTCESMFPDLLAVTTEAEGFDVDFNDMSVGYFAHELDERAVMPWSDLVYELNPHWLLSFKEEDKGKEGKNDNSSE